MPLSRLEYLFDRYVNYQATAEEEAELMTLLSIPENDAVIQNLVEQLVGTTGPEQKMPEQASAAILQNILRKQAHVQSPVQSPVQSAVPSAISPLAQNRATTGIRRLLSRPWMRAAAILILLLSGAVLWNHHEKPGAATIVAATVKPPAPVLPGGDKAILTLADGKTVALDDARADTFSQANVKIHNQPGLLSYHATLPNAHAGALTAYNTLATPRGGQYRLVLADGTKVWLNAASVLYFPTAFTGDHREVRLTGEAYFEVAKDKERPFLVNAGDMKVAVLGTHFNVNAYADDRTIRTSLLEGSVRITKGGDAALLQPGQQAVLDREHSGMKIAAADMDEVIAWKNGLFQFDGADINSIMQQIGRWYDVEIVFEGKIPANRFEGKISRTAQLSDVLQILSLSNIKFSVEGKKIIVK